MRRGTLWCPHHGPLLFGTRCVGCDCQHADLEPPATIGTVHMGFDLASKPDKAAMIRQHRVCDKYAFTIDDIEFHEVDLQSSEMFREQINRNRERMEETLWGAFNVPPHHFNCRSAYTPPAVEIITDPADQRGVNAKRVGAHP